MTSVNRRKFLQLGAAGTVALITVSNSEKFMSSASASNTGFPLTLDKIPEKLELVNIDNKTWKGHLTKEQYRVLRKHGTERSFTSSLNDEKRSGEYVCAGCGLLLFTSETKYDSGTGWPSFYDGYLQHIGTSTDFKLIYPRTEYHCKRCGGHQGHVFKDGPEPTGLRYCNNGVALKFVPA